MVEELLSITAMATNAEVRHLAKMTDAATGYLGLRKSWQRAALAARRAADMAERTKALDLAQRRASVEVVVQAVLAPDTDRGDVDEIKKALVPLTSFTPPTSTGHRAPGVKRARRQLRKFLHVRSDSFIGVASEGVGWAAASVVVWDLADPQGSFTVSDREELIRPWHRVFRPWKVALGDLLNPL